MSSKPGRCSSLRALATAGLCLAAVAVAQEQEKKPVSYEEAVDKYKVEVKRKPLGLRYMAWYHLAQSLDARAFEQLIKDYGSADSPHEFERSILVTAVASAAANLAPISSWRTWRTKFAKAEHAWLWFLALCYESENDENLCWNVVGDASLPTELRVAALDVVGTFLSTKVWNKAGEEQLSNFLQKPPAKPADRALWLEAWSGLFRTHEKAIEKVHKEALRRLVPLMTDPATTNRTRLVMARNFASALDRDDVGPNPAIWDGLLSETPTQEAEIAYAQAKASARSGFCGIVDHGLAIAFVVDASDSMLAELTQSEREQLTPLTGVKSDAATDEARAAANLERTIDWSKVKNRFDCARELVKQALRQLRPEQRFTVVLFGDRAEYLDPSVGLVPANKSNVDAACKKLDSILPGDPIPDRPNGQLRGDTNLHAGLLFAMRAGDPRKATSRTYGPRDFAKQDANGVDTVFLLSDGAPSTDDFAMLDDNPSGVFRDAETGATSRGAGRGLYPGPFGRARYLKYECTRLNLFQQARIHAVGIGEADAPLLEYITAATDGRCILIGK